MGLAMSLEVFSRGLNLLLEVFLEVEGIIFGSIKVGSRLQKDHTALSYHKS